MLRGDNTPLILGDDTNFQDSAIGHSDAGYPLTIGARVTAGHQAILHGCTEVDDCFIGMGARVLNGAVIGPECIVGAGALITEGKRFERGSLIVGAPARVMRQVTEEEKRRLRESAAHMRTRRRGMRRSCGRKSMGVQTADSSRLNLCSQCVTLPNCQG